MKYLILGAGPAGLTVANKLLMEGENSFLVLEQNATAGGLCRSVDVDGAPFDIGGGHFLDAQRPSVTSFLFQFMPEMEWNKFERNSQIVIRENSISYPIEANIWQMKAEDQVEYLKSIAIAGENLGYSMPNTFVEWVYWKLGEKIADDYMIPYNRKMFGKEMDELGTYWLEKLPKVSFEETLLSCIEKRAYGMQPGHMQFYYPKKYGYGELWNRMADAISKHIEFEKTVKEIDFYTNTIKTDDGEKYKAEIIITTIPWTEFCEVIGMPLEIRRLIFQLKHSSIQTEYYSGHLDTQAHWIYYPDSGVPYHRILVRHNFCPHSNGYWTETNSERIEMIKYDGDFKYLNQYAYPLNTIKKPFVMKQILGWSREHGVYGLGRWGEHQHYNSDVVVDLAMKMAEEVRSV